MHFERVTSEKHKMFEHAMNLYSISFPAHEQREHRSQTEILSDAEYHYALICDSDAFIGLVLFWETKSFIYIEHLCILPEMRNKQYGQKTLELLGKCGKTVILEIDPPVDSISVRRKGFYERCGFAENPYAHVHPPYHRGNAGHNLVIMSCPRAIDQAEYNAFKHYLDSRVMKDVF